MEPRPAAGTPRAGSGLVADGERITFEELAALERAGAPVRLLDVRRQPDFARRDRKAQGAIRFPPDQVVESAAALALPREAWLVAYCA